jgi:TatD DNase family protein
MKLNYIDIHSHLNLSPLLENKEVILAKMQELGVGTITVGTTLETSKMAIQIAEQNEHCWATIGVHPCDCSDLPLLEGATAEGSGGSTGWQELEQLAQHSKTVAIGETGLDYFRDQSEETKQKQVELFKKHIELANKVGKPLMLHVRASKGTDDAYYDALQILKEFDPLHDSGEGGSAEQDRVRSANFHFFSGSKKCMEDIVAAGFTISVDGPITFSHDYDEMIKAVPLDKIMIETDAPFAAPAPYRGSASWRTCEPWMVIEIAKKIAELKGIDLEVVQAQVLDNTAQFFALDF